MKLVNYTDENGYKHSAWIRDNTPESQAAKNGVPADPPDINQLDWDEIKRELHNELVDKKLINWQAVQRQQSAISGIVKKILLKKIISLYRYTGVENG